jgi:hypothetical protein
VYENADLIDAFIQANPDHLSADQLAMVAEWKRFVADDFYILDSRKFSVLGLASVQQFNTDKVHPTAPCKHPEKAPPFTAPRKS